MLRNLQNLEKFELRASGGRIGHVVDFLFDDRRWRLRYFVVDTGGWLDHRKVLIAPAAVHIPDWHERVLPVDLTVDQVRDSPTLDTEGPVSREQELALVRYYNWPMYWGAAGVADGFLFATPNYLPGDAAPRREGPGTNPPSALDEQHHVRSVTEVRGYRIEATDGEIGHVEDFVIDDQDWSIAYLIVDTRNWWPGKRVIVSPEWIYEVGWDEAKVFVDVSRDAVRRSPEYDPKVPLTTEYADRLHEHYGQPRRNSEP